MICIQSNAPVCYTSVSVDVGIITPRKATSAAATLAAQILVAGECSAGNASPQIQSQSEVGRFIERERTRLFTAFQRNQNAPKIQRQKQVCGGVGELNPGNEHRLFATTGRALVEVLNHFRIGSPAVSLSVFKDSLGLFIGKRTGSPVLPNSLS